MFRRICKALASSLEATALILSLVVRTGWTYVLLGSGVQCLSQQNWASTGPISGADNVVFSAIFDPDGNLYVGGSFKVAGGVVAKGVAEWNGNEWKSLGSGFDGEVYALRYDGGYLYAGGTFTKSGQLPLWTVARWNGSVWSTIPGTPTNNFAAMAVSDGSMYLATSVGGGSCSVAHWDGESWSTIPGEFSDRIRDLKVLDGKLYAAGYFTKIDEINAPYVAVWDGYSWKGVGNLNAAAISLLSMGAELYAGGAFTSADGVSAAHVAKWDGNMWLPLGAGTPAAVMHLSAAGPEIVASYYQVVSKWNGSRWSDEGSGFGGTVLTAAIHGTNFFVGGAFSHYRSLPLNSVARSVGTNWVKVGPGVTGWINVMTSTEDALYAAGQMECDDISNDSSLLWQVAKWTDGHWSQMGEGFDNKVTALAVYQGHVYAAGRFAKAGKLQANHVALWNGANWQPLGAGLNDTVNAVSVFKGELYFGGYFTETDGIETKYVARWNGQTWSAVAQGCEGRIDSMAATDGTLYVAGDFFQEWDGHAWSEAGFINWYNTSMAAYGSNLFVGGGFGGDEYFNGIIKYDGVELSRLGGAFDDRVETVACIGGVLYAGGAFTKIGDLSVPFFASWDGQEWRPMESTPNNVVRSICGSGAELYLGGSFSAVGDRPAGFAVKRILGDHIKSLNIGASGSGTNTIVFNGTPGGTYRMEYSDSLDPYDWNTLSTTNVTAYGTGSVLDSAPNPAKRFYRIIAQ